MAFALEIDVIVPPTRGPERPGGFLDAVEWVGNDQLGWRNMDGSQTLVTNGLFQLTEWELDAAKDATSSPTEYVDNFTYTGYLRRKFGVGAITYEDAVKMARSEFDDAAEATITGLVMADLATDITPGTPDFKETIALLERAVVYAAGSGRTGYILLPIPAAVYMADLGLTGDSTPAGTKILYSAGVTEDVAQESDINDAITTLTGYAFAAPYGVKGVTEPNPTLGDDFDRDLNDFYVTVEGTWNIGFNSAGVYSVTATL